MSDTEAATSRLRVLLLEDQPEDAELLRERLLHDGFDLEMEVATGRDEYLSLLTSHEYDIILADYTLPDFDAPRALEAAAEAGVCTPFICVSGTVTESQAVELLRHGADDYVLKDSIARLSFAIKRALRSAEETAALQASQERFQQLFEHLGDAVIVHDDTVLLANPAAQRGFGYADDASITGVPLTQLVHPDWMGAVQHVYDLIRAQDTSVGPFDMLFMRADGSSWFGEITMSPLRAEGRTVFVSTLRDLTVRREREAALEEYRRTLESIAEQRGRSLELARRALDSITAVISRTVEIRDPYTAGHQRRVAMLAVDIARQMGMPADEVEEIGMAAAIHDIGKVSIPAEVLSKPARLSEVEFELVKTHPEAGCEIISSSEMAGMVPLLVLQHHERCDGSGYPHGLTADQLLPGSKIMMVADVVEAMSSHRPYRTALGMGAARDEIVAGAGSVFDDDVVKACLEVLDAGFEFEEIRL